MFHYKIPFAVLSVVIALIFMGNATTGNYVFSQSCCMGGEGCSIENLCTSAQPEEKYAKVEVLYFAMTSVFLFYLAGIIMMTR